MDYSTLRTETLRLLFAALYAVSFVAKRRCAAVVGGARRDNRPPNSNVLISALYVPTLFQHTHANSSSLFIRSTSASPPSILEMHI